MRLDSRLVLTQHVTPAERRQMLNLMERHYENVLPEAFHADLDEKQWVIQVFEPASGELCGFSTQLLLPALIDGRPARVLFSGDTIIDRQRWGDRALPHLWGRLVLSLLDELPEMELYWLLLSKGYRTYRYLPLFFHEFYPRYDQPTPAWIKRAIDSVAGARYADAYDASAGIVRATSRQYRLREELAPLSAEKLEDPHIRYFVERNARHVLGDELCCWAPLTRENFTAAAWRVIGREPLGLELACRGFAGV